MTDAEVEKLLQEMGDRAIPRDVWAQMEADFINYGRICYRIGEFGMVERIAPSDVFLDIDP